MLFIVISVYIYVDLVFDNLIVGRQSSGVLSQVGGTLP